MATPQLADRLEALRVAATTPTHGNILQNTSHSAFTPIQTHLDNAANVGDHNFSPVLSPDELVIRQRGRRRVSSTFSPDTTSMTTGLSPFQRTPTKNFQLTSGMILRSSPRKRLTMGSTPPDPTPVEIYSPTKAPSNDLSWRNYPTSSKKLRLTIDDRPLAQTNTEVPLSTLLQGLSQQQLIDLIMVNVCKDDPAESKAAEEKIRAQLPIADITVMETELVHAKRLISKSLPTSRLCKKTDASAYSKASLHLNEFKRILQTQAKLLHDSSHWDALIDYVCIAWRCVASTPNWDSVAHNSVRRQCFKALACYCIAAIKHGGPRLGPDRLEGLEKNLREWAKDYEDVASCVNALQKILAKERNSL